MTIRLFMVFMLSVLLTTGAHASKIFIPMDSVGQKNHLKAYGIAYAALQEGVKVDWLLNYKNGSFGMNYDAGIELLCKQRGVSYKKMTDKDYAVIVKLVGKPNYNGAVVKLEKAPKIAVYTPVNKEPWDDAVTLALTYAEIPFDKIYVDEVLAGDLDKYDWLHLHHEDFTGQYGKFWPQFHNTEWYKNDQRTAEALAAKHGYKKVSQMQVAVVKKIRDFVGSGGNMFAMCSATETFDIALAAEGTDISDTVFDGDITDPYAQSKLDFSRCFAFRDFTVITNPFQYGHSNIDNTNTRTVQPENDYFDLVPFPAKLDPVPAMLTQNHTSHIKGFMGQTTAFRKEVIKPDVLVMGDRIQVGPTVVMEGAVTLKDRTTGKDVPNIPANSKNDHYLQDYEARYIHGEYGKGTWTFYGGHDPEAYRHMVNDPATDLARHPNSPGYRLILNNVLCPAAKRQIVPTVVCCDSISKTEKTDHVPTMANPIKIYPNPANNELIISAGVTITSINIFNTKGEEVFKHTYNSEKISVDMDGLPSGMYLIKVNGEYAGKVVKN